MKHQAAIRHGSVSAPLRRSVVGLFHGLLDGVVLVPIGVVIALVWANAAPESYFVFSHRWSFAVNEIGMAFFFALITQEIVDAAMPTGALHSWRRWSMPVVAAVGGALGSAAVYLTYVQFEYETVLVSAWPIALSVDVVMTYYVLKVIMHRSAAVPFALALAMASNILAIVLVAPRYLVLETRTGGVTLLVIALGLAALFRAWKIRRFWPYLFVCGPLMWVAFYWEGLHPAFSLVPLVIFLPHEARTDDILSDPPRNDRIHRAEHEWNDLVHVVVFLFVLVNAGVTRTQYDTGSWAMLLAQVVGRPVGMLAAILLATVMGLHLPRSLGWREMVIVAFATSSGFTIALFLATGMLAPGPLLAQIKIGVLGSAVGALIAFAAARILKVRHVAR